jgi:hypothetical protein
MISGPAGGDSFRPEWLTLAVPALLDGRVKVRTAVTIGLVIGDRTLQLRATRSGFDVGPCDGRKLDASLTAVPACILGLAAGALTLGDARALGLVEVDGDETAIRAVFGA